MKQTLFLLTAFALSTFLQAQNVGIGMSNPLYRLDVQGACHVSGNIYTDSYVGIGTATPAYKLTVQDGSLAIYNSTDDKTWHMNYTSGGNYFALYESGVVRMAVANGGNIGIGTTAPSAKLDVVGTTELNGAVDINGNTNVSGTLVVNNNKGVLYNLSGSTNIKHYTRAAAFSVVNLQPHSLSPEGTIGFIGGFSEAPQVYVGNITSNGGTTGPLYQLQLIIYDVTATSCKCRILNTSNAVINQSITWNIMCIGE